jgi:O-antigen ligase
VFTLNNPGFGVGLGNYSEHFRERHFYRDPTIRDVFDARAAQSPHSNVLWISTEMGVTGLILYLAANAYLLLMGWRALKRASSDRERTAAACFLALLTAYWIPGLTLASGEYSDVNLFFFFLLGALSGQFSRSGQLIEPRGERAD